MNIDLTPVFQAIIALLAALITYKLIPWIRSKTTEQQQDNLITAARIAVYAAEQLYGAGHGDDKLEYAVAALQRAGYNVDTQLVREAIEDAVRVMTQYHDNAIPDEPDTEPEENEQTHPPEQEPDA